MADRVSIPATALRPYRHAIVGRRPDGKVLAIQVVHIRRHGDRLLFGLDDHTSVSIGVDENITVEDWSDHLSPGERAAADAWVPDDAGEEVQDSGLGSLLIIVGEACAALGVAGPAELPEAIAKVLAERDRYLAALHRAGRAAGCLTVERPDEVDEDVRDLARALRATAAALGLKLGDELTLTELRDVLTLTELRDVPRLAETAAAARDRLARILAVERGDATQAPDGWRLSEFGWHRPDGRYVRRFGHGACAWGYDGAVVASTALEAMEAVDAEVSRG